MSSTGLDMTGSVFKYKRQEEVPEEGLPVKRMGSLGLSALARSRPQALTGLLHVATEGLGSSGTVLAGVLVSEISPLGVVSGFDGG